MGNPFCPFCGGFLKLETRNILPHRDSVDKRSHWRGDFYICHSCKKHWPRSAAIMKATARDGTRPRK